MLTVLKIAASYVALALCYNSAKDFIELHRNEYAIGVRVQGAWLGSALLFGLIVSAIWIG